MFDRLRSDKGRDIIVILKQTCFSITATYGDYPVTFAKRGQTRRQVMHTECVMTSLRPSPILQLQPNRTTPPPR